MKAKRFYSLFIAIVICLSSFAVFAQTDEEVVVTSEEAVEEIIVPAEETADDPTEEIYSEYYPVGLNKVAVKGVKKGNAALILAHVKKGEGLDTATQIYISSFYVDENNKLTLIIEDEGMFLINK